MHRVTTIGRIVRIHREAAGLSRRALSELTGVGTTALYDLERGKETVQLRTLLLLLEALNIDLRLESPLMATVVTTLPNAETSANGNEASVSDA